MNRLFFKDYFYIGSHFISSLGETTWVYLRGTQRHVNPETVHQRKGRLDAVQLEL